MNWAIATSLAVRPPDLGGGAASQGDRRETPSARHPAFG
jgi:hypothetical protein